jgi:hypothetical protein
VIHLASSLLNIAAAQRSTRACCQTAGLLEFECAGTQNDLLLGENKWFLLVRNNRKSTRYKLLN